MMAHVPARGRARLAAVVTTTISLTIAASSSLAPAHAGKSGAQGSVRGDVHGSVVKSQPNPVVRDHRGGGNPGGGVVVGPGKERHPGGLCAGWFC
jgi:hypothetical protein